jgi:hypothetical protein
MKLVVFLIQAAFVILVVAIVLRLAGYDHYNQIPVIGTTPGGLHRLVDTIFLLSIALGLVEVHHLLSKKSSEKSAEPDQKE